MKVKKYEMVIPGSVDWDEFTRTLTGPMGLNFHQDEAGGLVWKCPHDESLPTARRILEGMFNVYVEETIGYFHMHGAGCDCEILWNIGQGVDLPTHLYNAEAAP